MRLIRITQVELQPRSTAGASLKETERWVNPAEVKELRKAVIHDPNRSNSGSDTKGIDHNVLALKLNGEEIFIKDEPLEEMASTVMGPQEDIFAQIQQAVIAWFAAHPVHDGEPGPGPSPEEIAFAVSAYIQANPPQRGAPGQDATVEQIALAVAAYFGEHPIPAPIPGTNGREIELQRTTDFIQWRYRNDPAWTNLVAFSAIKGDKGDAGKSVSIRVANGVIQWQNVGDTGWSDIATLASLKGGTGDNGKNIELQTTQTAIQWRVVGASTWIDLVLLSALKGAQGPAGQTLLAQINVTDQATLAITLGVVDMRFGCPGAVVGERYLAFVRSYKLNGAASATPGRPAGYYVVAVDCMVADTINIAHMRPALALGSKYELFTDIVKVNVS